MSNHEVSVHRWSTNDSPMVSFIQYYGEKVGVGSQYFVVNALSSTMVDVPIITMKRSNISVHL